MADYFNSRPATAEARTYATINGTDMRTYGLELTGYKIGAPVPVINLIDVPGRMGKLDATEALNGCVSYSGRKIELYFHTQKSFSEWHGLMSALSGAFDGVESKVVFSKDPEWYYKGRFKIDFIKSNPISGDVVLTCENAHPLRLKTITGSVELSGGFLESLDFYPNREWIDISSIIITKTTTTHSEVNDNVSFNARLYGESIEPFAYRNITLTEDDKKYFAYFGSGEIRQAMTLQMLFRTQKNDCVATCNISFEAGVF